MQDGVAGIGVDAKLLRVLAFVRRHLKDLSRRRIFITGLLAAHRRVDTLAHPREDVEDGIRDVLHRLHGIRHQALNAADRAERRLRQRLHIGIACAYLPKCRDCRDFPQEAAQQGIAASLEGAIVGYGNEVVEEIEGSYRRR